MMKSITAMTIGGSDSSGGAGIQADLKAFTALNIHGTTILTSITVQNTQKVKKIIPISIDDIRNQIEIIMEDIPIKHVKTGLLYQPETAKLIANLSKKYQWKLIVDPVLTATSGDSLATKELAEEIKKTLIPTATIITPNIPETEALTQRTIDSETDMKEIAKTIHEMGAKNVIIKGGHLQTNQAIDLLFNGESYTELTLPRIQNKKAHGSGCAFSALLTGYLAKGCSVQSSFFKSKNALWNMIKNGYNIGKGSDVLAISTKSVNNAPSSLPTNNHADIWIQLSNIVDFITNELPLGFTPEVGTNIGYALPNAKTKEDVCALNGRIIRSFHKLQRCGSIQFGVSKHIASIILAVMKTYPRTRCVMNIKYTPHNLSLVEQTPLTIVCFHRENEPETATSTMDWGTTTALSKTDTCPDIIYDTGGLGKEPMIRILGEHPKDVYNKLSLIITRYEK